MDSTESSPLDPAPPEHTPPQHPQGLGDFPVPLPPASPYRPGLSDDLRVPWDWVDVMLFVVLGVTAGFVITRGVAWAAIQFFGVRSSELFGTTVTTPMSIVLLLSQAVWDAGALLFLYALLVTKNASPFWQSIGWRETLSGMRRIRDSSLQFLGGGAVLAVIVSFTGAFLNSKTTLPIEELLQSRASTLLYGTIGVLVAPLVEETIFRGFLYPVIARWLGVAGGIVATGTLFGLMHAEQLWGGWGQIALLVLVGVVLTWVRARTGTVAASFFVHLGYNGLQLAGYLVYVIGGHH